MSDQDDASIAVKGVQDALRRTPGYRPFRFIPERSRPSYAVDRALSVHRIQPKRRGDTHESHHHRKETGPRRAAIGTSCLTEQTPQEFAAEHELTSSLRTVLPLIGHRVQGRDLQPHRELQPAKPYMTRLKWRDLTGGTEHGCLYRSRDRHRRNPWRQGGYGQGGETSDAAAWRGRNGSRRMEAFRTKLPSRRGGNSSPRLDPPAGAFLYYAC